VERLTPERIAELRLIAEAATKGPYEVVGLDGYGGPYALRMPHRSGRTWYGVEGIKRREDAEYFVAMNRNTVLALLDEIERLQHEVMHLRDFLAESEALASHLRQRYEALRAAVEDVAERIEMDFERAYQRWDNTAEMYDQGFAHALGRAEQMVRAVLEQDKQEVADDGDV